MNRRDLRPGATGAGFVVLAIGVAALYFATAVVGLKFAVVGNTVTLVWPPSGIALVAILVFGFRIAPGIAVGAFLANVWMDLPAHLAAAIATGNVLEAIIGAFLLKRLAHFRNSLERTQDVLAFITLAGLLSTMIAAFVGVTTLTQGGVVPQGEYASVWLKWWLGDMMGVLVVAPPLLVWLNQPRPSLSAQKAIEAMAVLAILLVTCRTIFATPEFAGHGYYTALAVFPFVIWGALRFNFWGATLVTLLVSTMAIWGTTRGTGPFAVSSLVNGQIGWSIFIKLFAVTGLLLAASSEARRRGEIALQKANDELAWQKKEAEQANQAKSRFLAAASHDLRQPLHAIALYAASMRPRVAERKAAIILGKIEAAAATMENEISTILDVSKLEAGMVEPVVSNISVRILLEGLYDIFHQEASAKGVQLRLHYCDVMVVSDPVLLERILLNLISNALRYTDRGGVLISARQRDGLIRFQVWDTGRGILPEHMDDIFQEFFQVPSPKSRNSHGLGLGLAIVDRLAHLLGHPLTVRSSPGKGTVFSLDVPCNHAALTRDPGIGATLDAITRLHGLVAIVDDDLMVLDSQATLLKEWGLQVIRAASGGELLGKLERAPDILITDFRLGGSDGLEVAEAIQQYFPGRPCQVVIVTGDTSEQSVSILSETGYQVVYKPIRPGRLRALMANLLKSTKQTQHVTVA